MEREKLIALVTKAQGGDAEAVEALFGEFYNDVYYFAYKTVKDPDIACDITQESFLEVINTLDKLQEPAAFKTWLRQITYHQCTRYFKQRKDVQVEEDEEGNSLFDTLVDEDESAMPAQVYEKAEFRQTILDMLDTLSEEQRSAVMLYYFDELSVEEVAQIQGVAVGTVKSRLNYARKALKTSVETYEKKHGIKLHSFAPLPLLLYVLRGAFTAMPAPAAAAAKTAVCAAAGGAGAATATAASTSTGAASGVMGGLGAKLTAGVAAAALAVTGTVVALQGNPEPGSYASENMQLYRESQLVAQEATQVLDGVPTYIVTEDGQVYELMDEGSPTQVLEAADPEQVQLLASSIGYTDKDGVFHGQYDGQPLSFAGIRGEAQFLLSPWVSDLRYVISLDEAGAWASSVDTKTGQQVSTNLPLQIKSDLGILEFSEIKGIRVFAGLRNYCCVHTETGFFYGSLFMITDQGTHAQLVLSGAHNAEGRVLDYEYAITSYQPLYVEAATGQLVWREHYRVPMPPGYTAETLRYARTGPQVVMVFEDGAVYRWQKDWEQPQLHPELTALNREGHVRKLFVDSYAYSSRIVAWMDDNTLYTVADTAT